MSNEQSESSGGWPKHPLIDFLEVLETGKRPKGGVRGSTEGIPSLGGEHLADDGSFRLAKMKFVPDEFYGQMKRGKIQAGDVLIVKDGATTGKVALVTEEFPYPEAAINEHLFLCRPAADTDPRFLFYSLHCANGQREILRNFRGSAQGGITRDFASGTFIAKPPTEDQVRIADYLDAAIPSIERLVVKLTGVPDLIIRCRQALLRSACSGSLTEDWREQNSGETPDQGNSLEFFDEQRKLRWDEENARTDRSRRYRRAKDAEVPSEAPEIPESWNWISVDQLSSKVVDGVHKKPHYVESGVPFVTVKNLTAGPGISFETLNYISQEDHEEFFLRANPEPGDLLISKDGTLGVVRAIRTDTTFSIFVSVALVKPVDPSLTDYLEIAFQSPQVQRQMVGVGSGLQHIHLRDLRKDSIPIPPRAERDEIVRRVSQSLDLLDHLERRGVALDDLAKVLPNAIIAKAMRGGTT